MRKSLPVSCNEVSGWVVASCAAKGIRGSMEDVSVTQDILAVLDGHGGSECADFIAPQLGALKLLPQAAWIKSFAELDDAFRAQGLPSGSTCVLAVMRDDTLEVANLGDSRAVLFRGGAVVSHTVDHKPGSPAEQARIARCGGKVQEGGEGPARIGGVAVSRAFGTFVSPMGRQMLKDPAVPHADRLVSCVPELFSWPVENGDILVLACDGVWDVLTEEDIGEVISRQEVTVDSTKRDIVQSARMIVERALQTSTDNVSCLVAEFGGAMPHFEPEPAVLANERACQGDGWPSFNRASREEQLEIGMALEYGDTLIEMMSGLETDLIVEGLWLGHAGDACFRPFLTHTKVTKVCNCAADLDRPALDGIDVFHLKWWDSEDQGKAEAKGSFRRLRQASRFIHDSIEAGEVVLVHCVQGVSRSATVVVAYLMEYQQMSMEEAVSLVKERHPVALKPFRFQEMLRAFHYALKG